MALEQERSGASIPPSSTTQHCFCPQVIVRKQGNLLKGYSGDAKKGTQTDLAAKLSQEELLDYMLKAPVLYNSESKSITFNRMISKFEELVQCLTPVASPAGSP